LWEANSITGARLAGIHARAANMRADALHKVTGMLTARYDTVVCEDLDVAGMVRSRRLARSISGQGFGAIRRMPGYKTTAQAGKTGTVPSRRGTAA
jgi:putative transposase